MKAIIFLCSLPKTDSRHISLRGVMSQFLVEAVKGIQVCLW